MAFTLVTCRDVCNLFVFVMFSVRRKGSDLHEGKQ